MVSGDCNSKDSAGACGMESVNSSRQIVCQNFTILLFREIYIRKEKIYLRSALTHFLQESLASGITLNNRKEWRSAVKILPVNFRNNDNKI